MFKLSIINAVCLSLSLISISAAFIMPSQYGMMQRIDRTLVRDEQSELTKECNPVAGYCHSWGVLTMSSTESEEKSFGDRDSRDVGRGAGRGGRESSYGGRGRGEERGKK